MAWDYTTGVLTSTGGTESAPDSLLEGIAIVQAADATRGYRNGPLAWLNNVEVRAGGSFIRLDPDSQIELRGSSFINPQTGGVMHDYRCTLIISTTTQRIDAALDFEAGSTLLTRRLRPNDPNPRIVYNTNTQHRYPLMMRDVVQAKVAIDGLDLYGLQNAGNALLFFGLPTIFSVKNLRIFGQANVAMYSSTYDDLYQEGLFISSAAVVNTVTLNRPTYYRDTPASYSGFIRRGQFVITNPSFLNNCWDGGVSFTETSPVSKMSIAYTYANVIRQGLTPIEGVNLQFTRARQSVTGTPTWTAPDSIITATTDAQGTYAAVSLLDAYREGTSTSDIERFNWTLKARSYSRRTAGETVFSERVLFQHSVNMSAGYSEEIQLLSVNNLTLTEAQAAALTGIAFVADGATGGTVTVTESRTDAELWAAYRYWISQAANFDSEDTWMLAAGVLDLGAWNMVIDSATVTGSLTTTGVITLQNGAAIDGGYIDANGNSFLRFSGIDAWTVYSDSNRLTQLGTGTGSSIFRFNYVANTTYYLTVTSAGTTFLIDTTPAGVGETIVTLDTAALLLALTTKVESIPTNPLLATSYIAPDNASIGQIKTKVDTLQNADVSGLATSVEVGNLSNQVGIPLQAVNYVAPANSDIASIKATVEAIEPVDISGLATAIQVSALGTPLQASSYTAPDNATIEAINTKVQTLQNTDVSGLPTLAQIEGSQVIAKEASVLAIQDGLLLQNQVIINDGVKKASLAIPHNANVNI